MVWILIVVFCIIGVIAYGAFNIRANVFIKSTCESSGGYPLLTFDDGPHSVYTPLTLDLLKKHDIKAVFFCIGRNVDKYPTLALRIVSEGHLIGNHTYDHNIGSTFAGWKKYCEQIIKTNHAIESATGKAPTLFRPPFGVTNPSIAKAIKACNMKTIGWNLRTFDAVSEDTDKIINKISNNLNDKSIVLLHDTNETCIKVLEKYLENNSHRFSSKIEL